MKNINTISLPEAVGRLVDNKACSKSGGLDVEMVWIVLCRDQTVVGIDVTLLYQTFTDNVLLSIMKIALAPITKFTGERLTL